MSSQERWALSILDSLEPCSLFAGSTGPGDSVPVIPVGVEGSIYHALGVR